MMGTFVVCLYLFLQISSTSGQCVDESPIPPVVPPTSWTAWYSVDNHTDGTDDESLTAVRAVYPSVCISPTLAECRVKFLHSDHITAGQVLATSCTPNGGLLCQSSDQSNQEICLDYEIRFECPSPDDALPDPHFYWDMSTKTSIDADEPITCNGTVTSIYSNIGGMTGTVVGPLYVADSYDSSDHLCALRRQFASADGYVDYGSANDKCISETACCTSGWSITFWMRYRSPSDSNTKYIFTTGGQIASSRGISIHATAKFSLYVRGDGSRQAWEMKMADTAIFPTDQWTHHCFTYDPLLGTKYYKDGVLRHSLGTVSKIDAPYTNDFDNVRMFIRSDIDNAHKPEGDFSDFKMFYKTFNATDVQNSYLKETSESNLVIHYLRKHSHNDSFDIELECLAKAGSQPRISWYRSDDGAHFYPISPSADIAIYESLPNSYRRRSVLMVRPLTFSTDAILVCEASDVINGGSVSKIITIPKRDMYWTPWLSADSPADGDDRETLIDHLQAYDILCKIPTDIQCRTVYEGIPSNESGQIFNINCTMSSGLECVGVDQDAVNGNTCYDYKVRYSCPEPTFRWTNWYDATDPDGTLEDESFDKHLTQSYPDLCSQPIGAECRIKGTNQDLIASGFIPEVPYLCNAKGFRCQHADNTGSCPDFEVRYRCPAATGIDLQINTLVKLSHHLDPTLGLQCSATIGAPTLSTFILDWAWFDHSQPYVAVPISQGGVVAITLDTSIPCCQSSLLNIDDFANSIFANASLVCIARDGIIINAEMITISLPSVCELPIGVSSGYIDLSQITPSSVKSQPFKVPGVNGLDPWEPAISDINQMLDFDLGVEFAITGVAIQGNPVIDNPTRMVEQLDLYHKDSDAAAWNPIPFNVVTDNGSLTSFTIITPNITTRFIRFNPTQWRGGDILMKVEIYGCAVGESALRILQLNKMYDVNTNNFTFTCQAEHYPLPQITWLANNVSISPIAGIFQISEKDGAFPSKVSLLSLIGFQPANDSVEFTCKATAGAETDAKSIYTEYAFNGSVTVNGDPVVYFGSDVIMTCAASGDDIYVMEWGHRPLSSNGTFSSIPSSGRFLIVNGENSAINWDSTLTIGQFTQNDEGEYACLMNSDTARDTLVVNGKSGGLRAGWKNATYDENTNTYRLECAVLYSNIAPDVIWVLPSGERVNKTFGRYQVLNTLRTVTGNLTKLSVLTVHQYSYTQDDGLYVCSAMIDITGESVNLTVETQYAYLGPIDASANKAVQGQSVRLTCQADDVDRVYHADWLKVTGNDQVSLASDAMYAIHEDRTDNAFYLYLDISSYSTQYKGNYLCSINNHTAEATVEISGPLGK